MRCSDGLAVSPAARLIAKIWPRSENAFRTKLYGGLVFEKIVSFHIYSDIYFRFEKFPIKRWKPFHYNREKMLALMLNH